MAKIPILGQFDSVTEDKILAVAEQISYESTTVAQALGSKQDQLTFDSAPTQSSINPVTSGGLYTKFDQVDTAIAGKQDTLTFDSSPQQDSTNPVTSGGIYTGMSQMETSLKGYTDTTSAAAASDAIENALASDQILGPEDVATDSEFNEMVHEIFP